MIVAINLTREARRDLLIKGAESVYGPEWRAPLANHLSINGRTLRRWQKCEAPIPDGALAALAPLLREEAKRLEGLAATIATVAQS